MPKNIGIDNRTLEPYKQALKQAQDSVVDIVINAIESGEIDTKGIPDLTDMTYNEFIAKYDAYETVICYITSAGQKDICFVSFYDSGDTFDVIKLFNNDGFMIIEYAGTPEVSEKLSTYYTELSNISGSIQVREIKANEGTITSSTPVLRSLKIGTDIYNIASDSVAYTTTAPTSANTSGRLKFVVLSSEPATKYDGYLYIITGA